MYAVIETGSKQYKVQEGDTIQVELLKNETELVQFEKILFLDTGNEKKVGLPYVPGCLVKGKVLATVSGPKVIAYKYKKRKNYRKKIGHRQKYTKVQITEIKAS